VSRNRPVRNCPDRYRFSLKKLKKYAEEKYAEGERRRRSTPSACFQTEPVLPDMWWLG
jgi:hypothetical protein